MGDIIKKNWIKKDVFNNLLAKMSREGKNLPSLDEVLNITRFKNKVYRGLKTIEVGKIIGSEGRYSDFDRNFLPINESLRFRLAQIKKLYDQGYPFPPISVFKIDDYYFVRDGNHRVSLAKSRGQLFIDAEITEYFLDVPITKTLTVEDRLLIQEHSNFLEATKLVELGREATINLSKPSSYGMLMRIIEKFVEIENLKQDKNLSFQEGARLWYHKIFLPFAQDAYLFDMLSRFPNRTTGDLYVWLQTNWSKLNDFSENTALNHMSTGGVGLETDDPINKKELKILKEIYNRNNKTVNNFLLSQQMAIIVVSVIIYVERAEVPKMLIARRRYHPSEGRWSLPVATLRVEEELSEALQRCHKNTLGLRKPLKMHQYLINDKRGRHPFGRLIAIGYLGVIYDPDKKLEINAGHLADLLRLEHLVEIPQMVYDHNEIFTAGLKYIHENSDRLEIISQLFPNAMPITELKRTVEVISEVYREKLKHRRHG